MFFFLSISPSADSMLLITVIYIHTCCSVRQMSLRCRGPPPKIAKTKTHKQTNQLVHLVNLLFKLYFKANVHVFW